MKSNPFYYFLREQTVLPIQQKPTYIMFAFDEPKIKPSLDIEGNNVLFHSHHISIYEQYDEGTNYNSLYHYTAYFSSHSSTFVVHVYFDNNNDQSPIYIKEDTLAYKAIANILPSSETEKINHLLMSYVAPQMTTLRMLHNAQINKLRAEYCQQLANLHEQLFDNAEQTVANIDVISNLIKLGESIKNISHNSRENYASLNYLKKQQQGIISKTQGSQAPTLNAMQLSSPDIIEDSLESATYLESTTETAIDQEKVADLAETFLKKYDDTINQIHYYKTLKLNALSEKVRLLNQIHSESAQLFTLTEHDNFKAIHDPMIVHKASIGIDYLLQTCQTEGANLLPFCLSTPTNIEALAPSLKGYASGVSIDWIDSFLRKGNTGALLFLINNGALAVNQYQIQLNEFPIKLSPLAAAYKLGHLACFAELLKLNANPLTAYEDDLPLAHTLCKLPVNNEYRKAFLSHSFYFPAKINQLCAALISSLKIKLLDPMLTEQQKSNLSADLESYKIMKKNNHHTLISRHGFLKSNQLLERCSQTTIEELKKSPEYIYRCRLTKKLSDQLANILKNQRQTSSFKASSSRLFTEVNKQIDADERLQQQLNTLGKESFLAAMDTNIKLLEDYIFVWLNQGKNLGSKKKKLLLETLKRIESAQQVTPSNAELIGRIASKVKQLAIAAEEIFKDPDFIQTLASFHKKNEALQEDEYPGLDFLEACEEETSGVKLNA